MNQLTRKARWLTALKEVRLRTGYTLDEAASELGLSCSAMSRFESGERSLEVSIFESLCAFYEADPISLLNGAPTPMQFSPSRIPPGERIRALRKSKGLKLVALANSMGVAQSSLSLLETGSRRLTIKLLERLLTALDVTPSEFFFPGPGMRVFLRRATGAAAAGRSGGESVGDSGAMATAVSPDLGYSNLITLEIDGDSMFPYYRDGDVVFCTPELTPSTGDICVVRLTDGTMLCKRVFFERGGILLRSLNPEYSDRTLTPDEFDGVWPVVGSYRREKGKRP